MTSDTQRDDLIRALGNLIEIIDDHVDMGLIAHRPKSREQREIEEAREIHAKATKR